MSFFRTKENTETKAAENSQAVNASRRDLSWVLLRPRITEKATDVNKVRAYVFDISMNANKQNVRDAVRDIYKVSPIKVCITSIKSKNIRNARTGLSGTKSGGKKAFVYLKEGESITLV